MTEEKESESWATESGEKEELQDLLHQEASFKMGNELVRKSKEEYKKNVATYPVAYIHLPMGGMDVRVGPKRQSEMAMAYQALGIKIKIPKNIPMKNGQPDPDAIMDVGFEDGSEELVTKHMDDLQIYEACSMTRDPVIHPVPRVDGEPVPQDSPMRNPDWWYWDDLEELDQEVLRNLSKGKGIKFASNEKFRK